MRKRLFVHRADAGKAFVFEIADQGTADKAAGAGDKDKIVFFARCGIFRTHDVDSGWWLLVWGAKQIRIFMPKNAFVVWFAGTIHLSGRDTQWMILAQT